jgi:alcohol dehydrogenase (cytochrome c)
MHRITLLLALMASLLPAQVRYEDILASPNKDWLTYAGDYRGTRHSPLTQITTANVNSVVPKWTYHVPGARGLRVNPVVHNGVMYIVDRNEVRALDAVSGRVVWTFVDTRAKKKEINRGVALLDNSLFFATSDCVLTALDRRTGAVLWQTPYAEAKENTFSSAAPLVLKDRVIVGIAGGDQGLRGFIAAFDPKSGKEVWRTYTVPARGEKGSETWGEYIEYGGGATWLSGTYDPETNTLYWTTGNPWPDFYAGDRKGDNLYTCSLLALDPATGKMKWYFQFTPGDTHDWDAQSWPILIDVNWKGKPRKVVLHANRNGFFYVLDRLSGEFLAATKMLDQLDWAVGIDEKGRPIKVAGKDPTPTGNRVCPGVVGATNWMSQSYSPQTGLLYLVMLEQCDVFTSSAQKPEPNKGFAGGGAGPKPRDRGQFFLRALNPLTGERVWQYPMTGPADMWSGAVSTAGGVVFFGDDDGHLVAVDGKSGKHLWHYYMGENMYASPIVYEANGKQHVAIASATSIFSFALFEAQPSVAMPERSVLKK